jgi:hypothetical protein
MALAVHENDERPPQWRAARARRGTTMATAIDSPEPTRNACPDCGAIMKPVTLGDRQDPSASVFECPACGRRRDSAPGVVNR